VAEATLNLLSQVSAKGHLEVLLNFLHYSKATAVFEILQPSYQHVVDLSYLGNQPALKFITWTSAFKDEDSNNLESYCCMAPDKGIDFAQTLAPSVVFVLLLSQRHLVGQSPPLLTVGRNDLILLCINISDGLTLNFGDGVALYTWTIA